MMGNRVCYRVLRSWPVVCGGKGSHPGVGCRRAGAGCFPLVFLEKKKSIKGKKTGGGRKGEERARRGE